jgi:hypothetical protein
LSNTSSTDARPFHRLPLTGIKVIDLPREIYFAVAREAKIQKIPLAGHVPPSVRLTEASDAGQKSVEHLTGMGFEASIREEQVRKECVGLEQNESSCAALWAERVDPTKAAEIYWRLARNHTWQVPTLILGHNYRCLADAFFANDRA